MQNSVKIMAGSVNNLSDGRFFSTFAEWVGFILNPANPAAVEAVVFAEISAWLAGPVMVGEFGGCPIGEVNRLAGQLQLAAVQTKLDCQTNLFSPQIKGIIHHIDAAACKRREEVERLLGRNCDRLICHLLDFGGQTWAEVLANPVWDARFLARLCKEHRVMLQLQFAGEQVVEILQAVKPYAIRLQSGREEKTGLRSFDELYPIIDAIEEMEG